MTTSLSDRPYADEGGYEEQLPVRMTHQSVRGPRGSFGLTDTATLGAEAAAKGFTTHQVNKLLSLAQTLGTKTAVEMFPEFLKQMDEVQAAKIGEIVQQVKELQKVTLPAQGWRGALGQVQPGSPEFVNLDQVLGILARATANQNR